MNTKIHFNIDFANFNSFSEVALGLAKALEELGIPISVEPSGVGNHYSEAEKKLIAEWMQRDKAEFCQIKWSHYWQDCFSRQINGTVNLELFAINYEFTENHYDRFDYWIKDAVASPTHKLAISSYCRSVLIKAGCSPYNVSVVPLGFNTKLAEINNSGRFKRAPGEIVSILTLANSADLYRYGADILLAAFCEEFYGNKSVELVIKDYNACNDLMEQWIRQHRERLGNLIPNIRIIKHFLSKEELAQVYLSADAFIAPFRGEGFAIKVLDAFAAQLPVAVPLYSGPTEYANLSNCYPIDYDLVPLSNCYDKEALEIGNAPHWAEPKLQSVKKQLRNLVESPLRQEVAYLGRETALKFSWTDAAKKLVSVIEQVQQQQGLTLELHQPSHSSSPIIMNGGTKLSVIMPTYNRADILQKTLVAYQSQIGVDLSTIEFVIVDDGSQDNTGEVVNAFRGSNLNISYHRQENAGPGAARNLGISQTSGKIILIVGDDMVPNSIFLKEHIEFHQRYPDKTEAMLGFIDWHPELEINFLMEYITSVEGQQFGYFAIPDKHQVPSDFFYSSNISLKSQFLAQLDHIFDTKFIYAAFEDIDLAYRLSQLGMRLRYNPSATAYHHHQMNLRSFFQRQYKTGQMCKVLRDKHADPTQSQDIDLSSLSQIDEIGIETAFQISERLETVYLSLRHSSSNQKMMANLTDYLKTLYQNILDYAFKSGYACQLSSLEMAEIMSQDSSNRQVPPEIVASYTLSKLEYTEPFTYAVKQIYSRNPS